MFQLWTGDINLMRKELEKLQKETKLDKINVQDVTTLKLWGLYYTPAVYYFLYNPEQQFDTDKFIDSDSYVICLAEDVDKKSLKKYNKYVRTFTKPIQNNTANLYEVDNFIAYLYKSKHTKAAGFVSNLIFTGKITNTDLAKKIYLYLTT